MSADQPPTAPTPSPAPADAASTQGGGARKVQRPPRQPALEAARVQAPETPPGERGTRQEREPEAGPSPVPAPNRRRASAARNQQAAAEPQSQDLRAVERDDIERLQRSGRAEVATSVDVRAGREAIDAATAHLAAPAASREPNAATAAAEMKEIAELRTRLAREVRELGVPGGRPAGLPLAELEARTIERMNAREIRELVKVLEAPPSDTRETMRRGLVARANERLDAEELERSRSSLVGRVTSIAGEVAAEIPARVVGAARDRLEVHFTASGQEYAPNGSRGLAMVDEGQSIRGVNSSPRAAAGAVDLAAQKGWRSLKVEGTQEFERGVWVAATAQGIPVQPTRFKPGERDHIDAENARMNMRGEAEAWQRLRATLAQSVRNEAVLTPDEELRWRDARAAGQGKAAEEIRTAAASRQERDARTIEGMTAREVLAYQQVLFEPASREAARRRDELLTQSRTRQEQDPVRADKRDAPDVGRAWAGAEVAPRSNPLAPREDALEAWQRRREAQRTRLESQFTVAGREYLNRSGQVAFVDEGRTIRGMDAAQRTAQGIVDLASQKGWGELHVDGTQAFERAVVMAAAEQGVRVRTSSYQPDRKDIGVIQVARHAAYDEDFKGPAPRPFVPPRSQDEPAQRSDRRAESPAPGQPPKVERVISFGRAPYKFERGQSQSFYVKTEVDGAPQIRWGKDLDRAMREADARPGDRVTIERVGSDAVQVPAKRTSEDGRPATVIDTQRARWSVNVVERSPRETAKSPAQVIVERSLLEAGAAQDTVDRALQVAAGKEAALASQGRTVAVQGFDPNAPRQQPVPTVALPERDGPTRVR